MSLLTTYPDDNGYAPTVRGVCGDWHARQRRNALCHSLHSSHPGQVARLNKTPRADAISAFVSLLAIFAWVSTLCCHQEVCGAWKVGESFHQSLHQKISLTWENTPLREALGRLAESQSIAIFLDRRVDPQTEVSIQLDDVELDKAIRTIAHQIGLGIGYVGPVIYVGPPMAAARVATLAEMRMDEAEELPESLRVKLAKSQYFQWPRLSEPRWMLRKLAAEAGLSISEAERIPHDLWPAYQLPELTMCQRLTLLLANFGMTFQVDGKQAALELKPIPRAVAVQRSYMTAEPIAEAVSRLQTQFPQAIVKTSHHEIVVRTTVEDHWAIAQELEVAAAHKPQRASPDSQRFTLTAKDQPLGWLCEQVAKRVGHQIVFADSAQNSLEQRVSFSVEKVTLEELFQSIVEPAGLEVSIDGKVIRIR